MTKHRVAPAISSAAWPDTTRESNITRSSNTDRFPDSAMITSRERAAVTKLSVVVSFS